MRFNWYWREVRSIVVGHWYIFWSVLFKHITVLVPIAHPSHLVLFMCTLKGKSQFWKEGNQLIYMWYTKMEYHDFIVTISVTLWLVVLKYQISHQNSCTLSLVHRWFSFFGINVETCCKIFRGNSQPVYLLYEYVWTAWLCTSIANKVTRTQLLMSSCWE